jgi:membrane-associated protein
MQALSSLIALAEAGLAPIALLELGPLDLSFLSPETLLDRFGVHAFWVSVFIIFAECGLLIGFFLPGDSLLFTLGLFIGNGSIDVGIVFAVMILMAAAMIGNILGYWIGYKAGPPLFDRPNSRIFKPEHIERTARFFNKHGGIAIILARFLPIVRTFITASAGAARMDFARYLVFSAIGAVLWAGGLTVLGYFFGNIPIIRDNLGIAILLIVVVSTAPVVIHQVRDRRAQRNAA